MNHWRPQHALFVVADNNTLDTDTAHITSICLTCHIIARHTITAAMLDMHNTMHTLCTRYAHVMHTQYSLSRYSFELEIASNIHVSTTLLIFSLCKLSYQCCYNLLALLYKRATPPSLLSCCKPHVRTRAAQYKREHHQKKNPWLLFTLL